MHTAKMFKKLIFTSLIVLFGVSLAQVASAASVPVLTLTNNSSTVGISVTGADPNAVVNFYFPNFVNSSGNSSTNTITYALIDLGHTDANGSYRVFVASNSYGLSGGVSVYVSVDGAQSQKVAWPATTTNTSGSMGNLSLSQTSVSLVNGLSATIVALNTANILTVQSNSNPSVASAYVQQSDNSLLITGMNPGATTISVCASTYGCASIAVSVTAPTQTIAFSLPQVYLVRGQSPQSINIYGPGSYSISDNNQNALSAVLDGNTLQLQGLLTGTASVSVCANGWKCGILPVSILASGSSVPYQTATPAPISYDLSQAPQITSFSVNSNDVSNSFFGQSGTLNISFSVNQTVKNVYVDVAGKNVLSAGKNISGTYYAQYQLTGNEIFPIPVVISFTNLGNISNQFSFSMGNAVAATPSSPSSVFTQYLYSGMTKEGVSNPDVLALQERLARDGYFSGPKTGYFGPITKEALKAYQKAHGLSPVGIVGPETRNLLNKGI